MPSWPWPCRCHRALDRRPGDRSPLQARLLLGVAVVADTANPIGLEFDAAQRALEIAAQHSEERLRRVSLLLSAVGQIYVDFDQTWELSVDAQGSAQADGDIFVLNGSRALQGIILHLRDRHDEAEPLLLAAGNDLLQRGDRGIAATTLGFRASSAAYTGDVGRAIRLAERAVEVAAPLGDYHRVGTTRSLLAEAHALAGDVETAFAVIAPVRQLVHGADDDVFVPGMARVLGALHVWRGDAEYGVRWLEREAPSGRAADTYLVAQTLPLLGSALRYLGRTDEAQAVVERATRLAAELGMPRVLADAYEQQAHLVADDPERAIDLHYRALALRGEHGLRTFCVDSLDALAVLDVQTEQHERAVRAIAASMRHAARWATPDGPSTSLT